MVVNFLGAILIDTCNFSKEADRATLLDYEIIEKLEILGKIDAKDRSEIFKIILDSKSDIKDLSAKDLLIKDLKVINGIPLPGFPTLVKVRILFN